MGFKPSHMNDLPLSEKGQRTFTAGSATISVADRISDHLNGAEYHAQRAQSHDQLSHPREGGFPVIGHPDNYHPTDEDRDRHRTNYFAHSEKFQQHLNALSNLDPTHWAAKARTPSKFLKQYHDIKSSFGDPTDNMKFMNSGIFFAKQDVQRQETGDLTGITVPSFDSALTAAAPVEPHQGHTYNIKPNLVKNMLDIVEDLVKFEVIFNSSENYDIRKRARVNIDLIKHMLGYEPDLSKWEEKRRIFNNDLKKVASSQAPKHDQNIRNVADKYATSKGLTLNHNIPMEKVNPENARKIADAYHSAKHDPNHPAVKSAYNALINETNDQFKHILRTGLKVSKMKSGQENPYKSSKDLFHDIKNNNHISYFPTEQGFGQKDATDHPLMQPTEHINEGQPMPANDVFRIVHDYFGHAKEGNGFGQDGEDHAWKSHMQMYSPEAQKALTSETRAQNSFVNFHPSVAEHNKKNPSNTKYAEQKATILPDFAMKQGAKSVYSKLGKSEDSGKHPWRKPTSEEIVDLMKKEIDGSARTKIATTLKLIKDNQQILDQIGQSNPQALQAIQSLVQSMVKIFQEKTGENAATLVQELEIKEQMQQQQEQQEQQMQAQGQNPQEVSTAGHKDEPIHNRKLVYAPGSIRRYTAQDERIKDDKGDWNTFGGGVSDPNQGAQEPQ